MFRPLPLLRALPKHVTKTHSFQLSSQFFGNTQQAFLALVEQLSATQQACGYLRFSRVFVNGLDMAHWDKALVLFRSQVNKAAAGILGAL